MGDAIAKDVANLGSYASGRLQGPLEVHIMTWSTQTSLPNLMRQYVTVLPE
jgi:hypothetical protein